MNQQMMMALALAGAVSSVGAVASRAQAQSAAPQSGADFGMAAATGDFNDDGFVDLVVGAPGRIVNNVVGGMVHVYSGTRDGLNPTAQVFTQNSLAVPGDAQQMGRFGQALATGDFDGDGFANLAIGAPMADVDGVEDAGTVTILYGTRFGLSAFDAQRFHQNTSGIAGVPEKLDLFGLDLAAGDYDGNGRDDLAIGIQGEDLDGKVNAGAVQIIYGSSGGLSTAVVAPQFWTQSSAGIPGTPEEDDRLGSALAAGDLNDDAYDDLAIGVPLEGVGEVGYAGAVVIIHGSASGLDGSTVPAQIWHQNNVEIQEPAERNDRFGEALAIGNFNGFGGDDLAIGAPGDSIGEAGKAGSVVVLYAMGTTGLSTWGSQLWHQDASGVVGVSEPWDQFGTALAAGDFNQDGRADLAVSVGSEDESAGAVNVIYATALGLGTPGGQMWMQSSPGIAGAEEEGDRFGCAVAAGDFDSDGLDDLAVGVPDETFWLGDVFMEQAGVVNVIYGLDTPSGLGAAGSQLFDR